MLLSYSFVPQETVAEKDVQFMEEEHQPRMLIQVKPECLQVLPAFKSFQRRKRKKKKLLKLKKVVRENVKRKGSKSEGERDKADAQEEKAN